MAKKKLTAKAFADKIMAESDVYDAAHPDEPHDQFCVLEDFGPLTEDKIKDLSPGTQDIIKNLGKMLPEAKLIKVKKK